MREIIFRGPAAAPVKVREELRVAPTGRVVTDRIKVIFVTSGWSRLEVEDYGFNLAAGHVATVPGGMWCVSSPAGHLRTITFYVRREFLEAQAPWLPLGKPLTHQLRMALAAPGQPGLVDVGPSAMHVLAPRLYALAKLRELPEGDLGLLARVADVVHTVSLAAGSRDRAALPLGPLGAVPRLEVARAASLLHRELERPWTVAELARAVSLSASQLSRLFRRELGVAPGAYLWRVRVDRIAELLATRDMSIAETARLVGWSDHATASRAFRRRFGISPRDFVRRIRTFGTTLPEPSAVESAWHDPSRDKTG